MLKKSSVAKITDIACGLAAHGLDKASYEHLRMLERDLSRSASIIGRHLHAIDAAMTNLAAPAT